MDAIFALHACAPPPSLTHTYALTHRRNSWGTYWGEEGFFRLSMHKDNLGVEDRCFWAVPDMTPPKEPTTGPA